MNTFDSSSRLRIPPSPTGSLHLGTARTALYNMLLCKRYQGTLIFRLEDTDKERSKSEYVSDIINGFKWLGIEWDEGPFRQSEHSFRHKLVVQELLNKNLAYECFCSQEDLDILRAEQRKNNQAEGYDNKHRNLTIEEKENFRKLGKKPVIRFKLNENEDIIWQDLVKGEIKINTSDLGGDPVIAKENGDVLYNFAVVVDDHDARITHVVRGEDHLHNTAKQIALYKGLDWDVPIFGHVPLIFSEHKEKLSKRKHGDIANVSNYKNKGYLAEAIINYLIAMSWTYPEQGREIFSLEEAIEVFDIEKMSKSPAIYDQNKLEWFCKEYFKRLSSEEVLEKAKEFFKDKETIINFSLYSEQELISMFSLVKDGLVKIIDLEESLNFFFQDTIEIEKSSFDDLPQAFDILKTMHKLLISQEESTQDPKKLLNTLSLKTEIKKGKNLFFPIRLVISGTTHGPDLAESLRILGNEKVIKRIEKVI